MGYVNVGAWVKDAGTVERPPTKKRLREALLSTPGDVVFEQTSMMPVRRYQHMIMPAELRADDVLAVVGPDPYTKRSWYATVTRDQDGTVKIK